MRFGIFYEHQLPRPWQEGDEARLLREALEQIELADRLGIDYVWEVEHHFLEEYSHSSAPEVFLAAASQRTSRIRLGHGIVQMSPPVNHPARVAERIATLDLLSGGRVEFGTGEGSSQVELGAFGVPRDAKREMWEEALDVALRLMVEEPFTGHHGRWVDLPPRNLVPKPLQRPHPPLWLACSRRETIELAARKGMGALSFSFVEPEEAKPWAEAYYRILRSEECVPAGLTVTPELAVVVPFMCHEDEETAIERGIDGAHFFGYSLAHYYVFGEHIPGRTDVWAEFERYRHERGFARELIRAEKEPLGMKVLQAGIGSLRGAVGTPEQVADLIARYEAAGVDQVILVATAGRNRHEDICEALELFAERVLPRFAEGREEKEARKREELAEAIDAALARRPERPTPPVDRYVVSPAGELTPARSAQPLRRTTHPARALRHGVEEGVRSALRRVVERAPEDVLRRLAASPATQRALFTTMARMLDAERARGLDATIQFELTDGDRVFPWAVRVRDGRASARPVRVAEPTVTLRSTAADFLRIATGALPAGRAIMDERLWVEGHVGLASNLSELFGGQQLY